MESRESLRDFQLTMDDDIRASLSLLSILNNDFSYSALKLNDLSNYDRNETMAIYQSPKMIHKSEQELPQLEQVPESLPTQWKQSLPSPAEIEASDSSHERSRNSSFSQESIVDSPDSSKRVSQEDQQKQHQAQAQQQAQQHVELQQHIQLINGQRSHQVQLKESNQLVRLAESPPDPQEFSPEQLFQLQFQQRQYEQLLDVTYQTPPLQPRPLRGQKSNSSPTVQEPLQQQTQPRQLQNKRSHAALTGQPSAAAEAMSTANSLPTHTDTGTDYDDHFNQLRILELRRRQLQQAYEAEMEQARRNPQIRKFEEQGGGDDDDDEEEEAEESSDEFELGHAQQQLFLEAQARELLEQQEHQRQQRQLQLDQETLHHAHMDHQQQLELQQEYERHQQLERQQQLEYQQHLAEQELAAQQYQHQHNAQLQAEHDQMEEDLNAHDEFAYNEMETIAENEEEDEEEPHETQSPQQEQALPYKHHHHLKVPGNSPPLPALPHEVHPLEQHQNNMPAEENGGIRHNMGQYDENVENEDSYDQGLVLSPTESNTPMRPLRPDQLASPRKSSKYDAIHEEGEHSPYDKSDTAQKIPGRKYEDMPLPPTPMDEDDEVLPPGVSPINIDPLNEHIGPIAHPRQMESITEEKRAQMITIDPMGELSDKSSNDELRKNPQKAQPKRLSFMRGALRQLNIKERVHFGGKERTKDVTSKDQDHNGNGESPKKLVTALSPILSKGVKLRTPFLAGPKKDKGDKVHRATVSDGQVMSDEAAHALAEAEAEAERKRIDEQARVHWKEDHEVIEDDGSVLQHARRVTISGPQMPLSDLLIGQSGEAENREDGNEEDEGQAWQDEGTYEEMNEEPGLPDAPIQHKYTKPHAVFIPGKPQGDQPHQPQLKVLDIEHSVPSPQPQPQPAAEGVVASTYKTHTPPFRGTGSGHKRTQSNVGSVSLHPLMEAGSSGNQHHHERAKSAGGAAYQGYAPPSPGCVNAGTLDPRVALSPMAMEHGSTAEWLQEWSSALARDIERFRNVKRKHDNMLQESATAAAQERRAG